MYPEGTCVDSSFCFSFPYTENIPLAYQIVCVDAWRKHADLFTSALAHTLSFKNLGGTREAAPGGFPRVLWLYICISQLSAGTELKGLQVLQLNSSWEQCITFMTHTFLLNGVKTASGWVKGFDI